MAEGNGSGASLADFIWKNAEDLWGDFKHTDFGKIILPFTLLRRLECVLEKSREAVAAAHAEHKDSAVALDMIRRQGACYPFRGGLDTGIENVEFSPKGQLIAGGFTTSSQWPVRGKEPFAIQRIDWNGVVPFEIREINIRKDGFLITFTQPVDKAAASNPDAYRITTYTHVYDGGYGSPEVDQTTPRVTGATPSDDGLSVRLSLDKITEDHIHDFDLSRITSQAGKSLLHSKAYYTVNEIPRN